MTSIVPSPRRLVQLVRGSADGRRRAAPRGSVSLVNGVVDTRPVGPDELAGLSRLFDGQRNTRHCWCMAFCTTRSQFALGWLTGGNQRRFQSLAARGPDPMGVLASVDGEPVGWCACGPRSRYAPTAGKQHGVLRNRQRAEDGTVWLLPCLFVRADRRAEGVSYALIGAAVELARSSGAGAIEGWPIAGSDRMSDDAFLGRERAFHRLCFAVVDRPEPGRVIMRRELVDEAPSADSTPPDG
jgi:GNAT superfamily N-acetyltransferase